MAFYSNCCRKGPPTRLPLFSIGNLVSKQGLPIVPKHFHMHIQPFGRDLDVHQQKNLQSFPSRPNSLLSRAASPSDWPHCADGTRETQAGAPPRVIPAACLSRPARGFLSLFWLMAEVFFFHLRPDYENKEQSKLCHLTVLW